MNGVLLTIIGAVYALVALKVTGRLIRVRFNLKEFWNKTMYVLFGALIVIHSLGFLFAIAVNIILTMVEVQN